ncbi:unnamed protein product [Nesidiocoris tenuis]|uniref:G domain-containing protein n=1 Tax=Nesidiocoris tenuis TaxID=355587 RepID=A0A6H5FUM5_9HEMI|nr:unnamed protein product [Nesidiocoris tenuis]
MPNFTSRLNIRRCKGKMKMAAEGAQKLYAACKEIVEDQVDISSWHSKIMEEMALEYDESDEIEIGETVTVVSVSRTPGHTKHFQTIFLTPQVRLCDCPGLVFPSMVPKPLQVIMGSYPIAQLRDPYSSVKFMAERIDLVSMLKLEHPEHDDEWSAIDVCDGQSESKSEHTLSTFFHRINEIDVNSVVNTGWALKKGFYTARAARLDTYRAANHLLRMALDGKITLAFAPPGYFANKGEHLKTTLCYHFIISSLNVSVGSGCST